MTNALMDAVAAVRDSTAATRASSGALRASVERVEDVTRGMRSKLDAVAVSHRLTRSVLVVDDSPEALVALVAILAPIGCVVHAVTHDPDAVAALRSVRAVPHLVHDYTEARGLWHRYRSAAVVIDEHLRGLSGAAIASALPRGPRVFVVTSHHEARASLVEAARVTQAQAVIRTDAGDWGDRLRDEVLRALDDACG